MDLSAWLTFAVCIVTSLGAPLRGAHVNRSGPIGENTNASVLNDLDNWNSSSSVNSSVSPHFTNSSSFVWWDLEWGMVPHMTVRERNLWDSALSHAATYLEFGGGGSTVWALRHYPKLRVHTVDSHPGWVAKLQRMPVVRKALVNGRLVLKHANIGAVKQWGYPKSTAMQGRWPCYSDEIYKANEASRWDVIFVDGRFRVACMLKSVDVIRKTPGADGVRIITHDYNNRNQYWPAETFLQRVGSADTLVVFKLKPVINDAQLQAMISEYEYNTALF